MTNSPHKPNSEPLAALTAALAELGEATAAALAERLGLAYSTITPRLRALEADGWAQRQTVGGRTRWRLTDTPATGTANAGTRQAATRTRGAANSSQPAPATPRTAKADTTGTRTGKTRAAQPGTAKAGSAKPGTGTGNGRTGSGNAAAKAAASGGRTNGRAKTGAAPTTDQRAASASAAATGGQDRRGKGVLRAEVLALLQAHPDRAYKVGEVARLLTASPGAVANALHKLTHDGSIAQAAETPATFQAA